METVEYKALYEQKAKAFGKFPVTIKHIYTEADDRIWVECFTQNGSVETYLLSDLVFD